MKTYTPIEQAKKDAKQLYYHYASLTYNDTNAEGEAKHRLREIAMRIETGFYSRSTSPEGWQGIATAPRDASRILIYTPDSTRQVKEAWWALQYEDGPGYWQTPIGPTGRGYIILPEAATHWMPLPQPPATPQGKI